VRQTAEVLPVARVSVDVPLAHLDRPFDYLVPADLDADAVPGCRVRVRFAGKQVGGWLLRRVAESEHDGQLQHLARVVSPEPVLTSQVAELARVIADRYAGTLTDVLRLAIPPRHAKVEAEPAATPPPPPARPSGSGWQRYPRGGAFLDALSAGRPAHAVWQAMPGEDWPARLAEAAATVAAAGRGVVIVVPDHRDVARVLAACTALAGDAVISLTADLGPAKRYRRFLAALRGSARIVVGTRAAAFAPISDPGLLIIWDDGDDLHAEPRAPYPHARETLIHRAHLTGAALLCAGFARTAEAQLLVDTGWAPEIVASRDTVRAAAPRVKAIDDDPRLLARDPAAHAARLPLVAFEAARASLQAGAPVLVQVPRRGYVPALACAQCRTRARCRHCAGPLALPEASPDARDGLRLALSNGSAGLAGSAGLTGSAGLAGSAGVTGSAGTAKTTGTIGPAETAGVAGTAAVAGMAGAAGATGMARTAGVVGTAAAAGMAGVAGSAVAAGSAGAVGMAEVVGSAGVAGTVGTAGAARMAGVVGSAAAAGTIGTVGATGVTGTAGVAGAAEVVGAARVTGTVRATGTGEIGATGAAKVTGADGPVGTAGVAGSVETVGLTGSAGPVGATSPVGASATPGAMRAAALPACRWCGVSEATFACPACGSRRLRAVVIGARRTAEELGRAFPGTRVHTSGSGEVLDTVPTGPSLVVATPGAEPVALGGYGAALLLDSWALLGRLDLRAGEETLRRWLTAAALVRSGVDGGRVIVVADSNLAPVQAVIRWDPAWHAAAELQARTELGFPPAVRMAAVDGSPHAVATLIETAQLPDRAEILGPVSLDDDTERALVRVPRADAKALASALFTAQAQRVARKDPDPIRIRLDPTHLI